jgi:hypothetical protein
MLRWTGWHVTRRVLVLLLYMWDTLQDGARAAVDGGNDGHSSIS